MKTFKPKLVGRLYHIVAINDKTSDKVYATSYPMDHTRCCTMLSKFTRRKDITLTLEEFKQ